MIKFILSIFAVIGLIHSVPSSCHATSLWDESERGGRAISLFSDRTASRVGDLVTIVVNQSTSANKDQQTETDKSVAVDENLSALLGPFMGGERTGAELLRRNPHNTWEGSRTFEGGGSIKNTENITSTIQARITDTLPNKVIRIEATRRVEVGNEVSHFVLTGLVRAEDLTAANTILSTQVADLQIKQVGNGALSREQRKGWLTRVWETISPF
jgi:flagellar L-ring protein FlgH